MDIQGRTALVTGASRGLGAALARALAREAARTLLVARGSSALEETAESIRWAGGEAYAIAADLGDKRAIHRIAGEAAALAGDVDILIHAAAVLGPVPMPLLSDTECEDLEAVLGVNLVGPFRLTRALLGAMVLRGGGLVMSITSDASVEAYPGWGAYGVSKAALEHMTRIWAAEVEGTGVRLVTVDPGEMDTVMHAEALPEADRAGLASPDDAARVIVERIRSIEEVPNGARIDLAARVAAARAERLGGPAVVATAERRP
jgi:NAD(P)-dependent dehydrogenase (short-subunit alcohol dehydrogenase family)